MREPPPHLTDEDVLATVNEHWRADADRIGHLPVGFGAHHWRVSGADTILFVTFDRLGDRHTAESLEAAYAGARVAVGDRPRLRPGPARDRRAVGSRCRSRTARSA